LPASVSIIVPTYREALNVPELVRRVREAMQPTGRNFDLWLMDDPSGDGIERAVNAAGEPWVHLVTRKPPRGLGYAVLEGLQSARGDILVVMDADLSHPPERIPALVEAAEDPAHDMVIGSRYTKGGTIAGDWSLLRHINSRGATWLARLFTWVDDPMSGFLAMRRDLLARAAGDLDPIGYKIGLELIVKCRCRSVAEVPIHFSDRALGKSKMGLREQLRYIVHVRQLARWKYGELARFAEFALVGASGLLVNLATVTAVSEALKATGMTSREALLNTSVTTAVLVSMASNFLLNRALTFGDRARQPMLKQFLMFVGVCLIGAVVNWFVTTRLALRWTDFMLGLQTASVCGVLAWMAFNYLGSRLFVFRGTRV
jgi:dolichol-phosphate mannosyltransferase